MNQFSISQLAQFSGIKPHTIRIWEQRYKALVPQRSEGNTRYYTDDQLRRLLNIVSLSNSGYKISQLCRMTDEELFELQKKYVEKAVEEKDYEYFISQLISAGMDYDEIAFEKMFSHSLLRFGFMKTYSGILYPMLNRVGLMWAANAIPPAQEHYISNLVCQKLQTAIDALPPGKEGNPRWLLFLPENEFHEIGLLFANYLLRRAGQRVVYLGSNVPKISLHTTIDQVKIDRLLTFFVHKDFPENFDQQLENLQNLAKQREIFVACHKETSDELHEKEGIHFFHAADELEKRLQPSQIPGE